jgi:SAM-dependent methyltransferase
MAPQRAWKARLIERFFREQLKAAAPYVRGTVIDAGCGDKPYREFFQSRAARYIGLDVANNGSAEIVCDVRYLPIAHSSADTVVLLQVLDDVPEPVQLLEEIRRVLRPGGSLILSVNQCWRLHNAPHDYFRFTPFGLRYLFERVAMNVVTINPMGGMWAFLGTRLAFWLDEGPGRRRPLRPLVRIVGRSMLWVAEFLDDRDFHPEDTQNNFVVATKPLQSAA